MSNIAQITQEILDVCNKHQLSRMECVFVLKAAEMSLQEEVMRDIINGEKQPTQMPGVN